MDFVGLEPGHGPGNGQSVNCGGAGILEGQGAFTDGRACGDNVIEKQDAFSFNPCGPVDLESPFDVLEPFLTIQPGLRLGPVPPPEGSEIGGNGQSTAQHLCKNSHLIEPPLPQAPCMEWNGQDQVHRSHPLSPDGRCQEVRESRSPVELSPELELVNAFPDRADIQGRRSDRVEGVFQEQAVSAQMIR